MVLHRPSELARLIRQVELDHRIRRSLQEHLCEQRLAVKDYFQVPRHPPAIGGKGHGISHNGELRKVSFFRAPRDTVFIRRLAPFSFDFGQERHERL